MEYASTQSQTSRFGVTLWPHGTYGRMEPLTNTVFFIPVELEPWVTLALVATDCVDANLLAAPIVDAALVGVWGTKMAPCCNSTSKADCLSLKEEAVDESHG